MEIDDDFIETLQLQLVKGRNYSDDRSTDQTKSLIVNEALVKDAGWEDPIGKRIRNDTTVCTIIGVVKDFHYFSLQHKIEPLIMPLNQSRSGSQSFYVRIGRDNIPAALKSIEKTYRQFDSNQLFSYSFLDQKFAAQYKKEQKQGNIFLVFTILAIMVSCLGLFGLVTFMVEQRIKEIGIRKVLGANVMSILSLVSKDFISLIIIAALIALPIAWWAMNMWLQGFAYRIVINWWIFLVAGGAALFLALLTIGLKSAKAAAANTVKSLRSE